MYKRNLIDANGTQNKLFYEFENIMYILYCIMDIDNFSLIYTYIQTHVYIYIVYVRECNNETCSLNAFFLLVI